MATEPQTPARPAATPQSGSATPMSADDVMKMRKQAGSIAEVIEPVQRTRLERTDQ